MPRTPRKPSGRTPWSYLSCIRTILLIFFILLSTALNFVQLSTPLALPVFMILDEFHQRSSSSNSSKTTIEKLANEFYHHHSQEINARIDESSAVSMFGIRHYFEHNNEEPMYVVKNNTDPDVFHHSRYIFWNCCYGATLFRKHVALHPEKSWPHIMICGFDSNMGAFSQSIPNRTAGWTPKITERWEAEGCSHQDIIDYINHPDTKAVITTQWQIFDHPKVTSVPLGIQDRAGVIKPLLKLLNEVLPQSPKSSSEGNHDANSKNRVNYFGTRTQLLLINSSPWEKRLPIYDTVIRNFAKHGLELKNQFQPEQGNGPYLQQLRHAKFILSPSGMGLDCFRHWEAMMMGTFPVIEHFNRTGTDGWFRTMEKLPVAWIDSYDNLTPQWLEKEYRRIVSHAHSYQYEKLTEQYWIDLIKSNMP
jgi:hypothetical protein